ncbi:hypothetical protein A3Q56_08213 [Intoshia linei]|uniref:EGF-like domain-containing protein n=1 Tax=Intoshia linei TaxID=1819745 RepID=A0A177ART4_9BILA|nr:hypothetical protein A3Q56_08213 [Intoshia linei]
MRKVALWLNWWKEVDECSTIPCQNSSVCIDGINSFTCVCTSDYVGRLCELRVE